MRYNILYILFFLTSIAIAQDGTPPFGVTPTTAAYVAQTSSQSSLQNIYAINRVTIRLTANGDDAHLDRMWFLATDIEANAKISVINPTSTQITAVNSPTFTPDTGYKGGLTIYLNLGVTFAGLTHYTQNDASFGIFVVDNIVESFQNFGAYDVSFNGTAFINNRSPSGIYMQMNDGTGNNQTRSGARGLLQSQRTTSTNYTFYVNNGAGFTKTATSTACPSINYYLIGSNSNGTAVTGATTRVGFFYLGDGSVDHTNMYAAEEEYRALIKY